MKYTRDELARKLVAEIEPMPTGDGAYSYRCLWMKEAGKWRLNPAGMHPLTSLDDAVQCAEVRDMRWRHGYFSINEEFMEVRDSRVDGHVHCHVYTDGNHALALALAAASALDGERAEVADG